MANGPEGCCPVETDNQARRGYDPRDGEKFPLVPLVTSVARHKPPFLSSSVFPLQTANSADSVQRLNPRGPPDRADGTLPSYGVRGPGDANSLVRGVEPGPATALGRPCGSFFFARHGSSLSEGP